MIRRGGYTTSELKWNDLSGRDYRFCVMGLEDGKVICDLTHETGLGQGNR